MEKLDSISNSSEPTQEIKGLFHHWLGTTDNTAILTCLLYPQDKSDCWDREDQSHCSTLLWLCVLPGNTSVSHMIITWCAEWCSPLSFSSHSHNLSTSSEYFESDQIHTLGKSRFVREACTLSTTVYLAHTNAVPTDPNLSFSFLDSRTLQSNRIWSVLSTSLVSQSMLTPSDHSGGNGKWDQKHWEDLTLKVRHSYQNNLNLFVVLLFLPLSLSSSVSIILLSPLCDLFFLVQFLARSVDDVNDEDWLIELGNVLKALSFLQAHHIPQEVDH